MTVKLWTVVRYPSGSWSGGGIPSDPDYLQCEVYLVLAESFGAGKKRRRLSGADW